MATNDNMHETTVASASTVPKPACPRIHDVGMTLLHVPTPDNAIAADIVFVHGLMGHPRKTWQYGKEPKPTPPSASGKKKHWKIFGRSKSKAKTEQDDPLDSGKETGGACFWPFDLLPHEPTISNTRIMVYGYDSHPTHFYKSATNRMSIMQHGRDILHKVAGERDECGGRPLIFVTHSLGGILVKAALNESKACTKDPARLDVKDFCRAIVFMATPHQGAGIADWGGMLSNIVGAVPGGFSTNSGVLKGLSPDSETLEIITGGFNDLLEDEENRIKICCVREGTGVSNAKGIGGKVCCK